MKDIKEDLTNRKLQYCYVMGWKAQFGKEVKIAKLIYGSNVISIKMPTEYFEQLYKLIMKYLWRG